MALHSLVELSTASAAITWSRIALRIQTARLQIPYLPHFAPQQKQIIRNLCSAGAGVSVRERSPSSSSSSSSTNRRVETVPKTGAYSPFSDKEFSSLKLSHKIVKRLEEEGIKSPTDVQAWAIPVLLQGHDAALQSYTGSGKTLAYLLPILSKLGPWKQVDEEEEEDGEDEENGSMDGKKGILAVVVVPSRELAMQIVRETEKLLGNEHKKLVQQLIGGANQRRQEEALRKNKPFIVIGTPGRISELSRAGKLHTHGCRYLVLDEADQILASKYRDDMKRILEHVGLRRSSPEEEDDDEDDDKDDDEDDDVDEVKKTMKKKIEKQRADPRVERQTILVSATMPPAVLKAATEWGNMPLLIRPSSTVPVKPQSKKSTRSTARINALTSTGSSLTGNALAEPNKPMTRLEKEEAARKEAEMRGARESMPPNLSHYYVLTSARDRVDTCRKCINALDAQSVLVFMNFTERLKDTVYKLQARKMDAAALHGEMGKMQRFNVLNAFRNGKLRVLVTSEVGARGIDVPDCDLVVNLELPTDGCHYAHRGGRTGRIGRRGTVISICEPAQEFVIKKFGTLLSIPFTRCDVAEGQLRQFKE